MAIIRKGSFDDFSVSAPAKQRNDFPALKHLATVSVLREATRKAQPLPIEFVTSTNPRGLALKSLMLSKNFDACLGNLWRDGNELYILAWAWDLSGKPVEQYPGAEAQKNDVIIRIKAGQPREFLGAGIPLFPARPITGGLAVRIQLWESDQGVRNFGRTMSEVAKTIKDSKLTNLLSLVATVAGPGLPAGITVEIIKDAALELADVVGKILQANSDDYVDFYEGYYPAATPWSAGNETHVGFASKITLTRLT